MAAWSKATDRSFYGHTCALAFQPPPPLWVSVVNLTHLRSPPPEVRSAAANTQADATLPRIGVRGGANRRITPGPHSQPFGGARQRWHIWVRPSAYPQHTHE